MSNHDQMIGVIAGGRIVAGLVSGHKLVSGLRVFPPKGDGDDDADMDAVHSMPMDAMADQIARTIKELLEENKGVARGVGVGFPGIICNGVIEESPNLKQAKGTRLGDLVAASLTGYGVNL